MMALDSYCMIDKTDKPLKHFTPFWTSGSLGVNVFSQYIDQEENYYVFLPFNLLVPIIKFINECQINCTVVVPASDLTPVWMPLVAEMTKDALLLGLKGQKGILLYPSKKGYTPDKFVLPWNLWALRVAGKNSPETHTLGKLLYLMGAGETDISGFLGVGDSMFRYLQHHAFF